MIGKYWYILWPFGILYKHLGFLWQFGTFCVQLVRYFPFLHHVSRKSDIPASFPLPIRCFVMNCFELISVNLPLRKKSFWKRSRPFQAELFIKDWRERSTTVYSRFRRSSSVPGRATGWVCLKTAQSAAQSVFLRGCPGCGPKCSPIRFLKRLPGVRWGANPGPLHFIYFLIFSILPLSHSGSPPNPFVVKLKT
jgi:hypothetical protein